MTGPRAAAAGGVFVLVVTAWAAFVQFVGPGTGLGYTVAGLSLIAMLLAGAWLLVHFVRRHGDEIGEARFDTRNKDERDR